MSRKKSREYWWRRWTRRVQREVDGTASQRQKHELQGHRLGFAIHTHIIRLFCLLATGLINATFFRVSSEVMTTSSKRFGRELWVTVKLTQVSREQCQIGTRLLVDRKIVSGGDKWMSCPSAAIHDWRLDSKVNRNSSHPGLGTDCRSEKPILFCDLKLDAR